MTTLRTELPLTMDALRQVITTPDISVEVDYANSKLKGRAALIYLTNTALPNIRFDLTGCTFGERSELLDAYITQKSIVEIPQLVNSVMGLVLAMKGVQLPTFDEESLQIDTVFSGLGYSYDMCLHNHIDYPPYRHNVENLIDVLDNLPNYVASCSIGFRETYGEHKNWIKIVDDVNYTGFTFIHVLAHPLFLEYFTVPLQCEPTYFKQHYDEHVYGGKSLFSFITQSPIFAIMDVIVTGAVSADDLIIASQQAAGLQGEQA